MSPENQHSQGKVGTLGNQLTVIVFATVLVTLGLMGGAFWWITNALYEERARSEIADAAHIMALELEQAANALRETATRQARQTDVVSSINMIHTYEDPEQYQPLVFDAEKQALARHFHQVAINGGFDLIAAYTISGNLTAFALETDGMIYPGFQTYGPDGIGHFKAVGETEPNNPLMEFVPPDFVFFGDHDPATRAGRLEIREMNGGLMMDMLAPVLRKRLDGQTQNLGWLRAAKHIDKSFLTAVGMQTGVNIAFADTPDAPEQPLFDGPIPTLSLGQPMATQFTWAATADEFVGAFSVPLSSGTGKTLLLSVTASSKLAELDAFRNAAGVVLLLATLVFLPGMLYFMRVNVTRPLQALMHSAQRITRGEWVRPEGLQRGDEIGALAQAFDTMAETVQTRERELREKQHLLDGMVSNAPSLIQVKDVQGRYLMVNSRWEEFFGKDRFSVLGKTAEDIMEPGTAKEINANDEQVRRTRIPHQFEEDLQGARSKRHFYSIKFPLMDEHGQVYAICGISQDITERKAAEERLRLTQKVVDETIEGIMITDADNAILEINPAFSMITGYARDEVIGHNPSMMSSGRHDRLFYKELWNELNRTGQWAGEIWDRRKNGEVYPKWLSIAAVFDQDGEVSNYVGVFSDITKVKETERQLEQLAHYDALTSLPNRILFQDRLRRALARHRRHSHRGALMFLDLDRFKQVNDTLGHEKGDELLVETTARLLDCVREDDTVARLGGDEFTVILNDLVDENLAREVAERIIKRLEEPFDLSGHETFISASIGIVFFPGDGDTIEQLTRNADMAMYEAKNQGRATFRFFNEGMNARIVERMTLEAGLRAAQLDEQLKLFFQPKFDIKTRRVVSVEALVRWNHPERGLLTPDSFIPLAEETGLILDIGRWVIFEACRQVKKWRDDLGHTLPVAVNLSARQFGDAALIDDIAQALEQYGLDPGLLTVEITESMLMEDIDRAVGMVKRMKRLGLDIAIDDFGTGYSSLSQLRRLPFDELKVDRTFVKDLPASVEDMEIITAVISMAKSLNLKVVAEGVETFEQLDFLSEQGCDLAQGYLIGKPVEGSVLPLYLREDGPNAELMSGAHSPRPPRTLQ